MLKITNKQNHGSQTLMLSSEGLIIPNVSPCISTQLHKNDELNKEL